MDAGEAKECFHTALDRYARAFKKARESGKRRDYKEAESAGKTLQQCAINWGAVHSKYV